MRQATAASQTPGAARAGGKSDLPTARPGPGAHSYSLVNDEISHLAARDPHPESSTTNNSNPKPIGSDGRSSSSISVSTQSHVGYASSQQGGRAALPAGAKGQGQLEPAACGVGGREGPLGLLGDIMEDAFRSGEDRGGAVANGNSVRSGSGIDRVASSLQGHQQQKIDAGIQGSGRRGSDTGASNGW